MRTIRTACHKNKRGVSTILGTLIFVGILFTSVIPMYLVMNQADTIYARKVQATELKDEEREKENLYVYAYPESNTSDKIKADVDNIGNVPIKVVRVWINEEYHSQDELIASMSEAVIGPFNVSLQAGQTYTFKVTTERGNVFHSRTGSLYYDDIWYMPSFGICVNIANDVGKYRIKIVKQSNQTWSVGYNSTGNEFGDVIRWFEADNRETYIVSIKKHVGGQTYKELPGCPTTVELGWPDGPPIVFAYANGIGV